MDDFDAYTTHKHPGNPVPVDGEKRDLHLRIAALESALKAIITAADQNMRSNPDSYYVELSQGDISKARAVLAKIGEKV